jgi:serine/threonine protein kinase
MTILSGMDFEHWKQLEAIYHSAIEITDDEREDFLAIACAGDEALRREILSLISSAESADSFMEEPVMSLGLTLLSAAQESLVGQSIGRYLLLELLGRGGMGEVYLAHDPRLNRRIALKLLPVGTADEHARARRFEQEARAASAISHPNVSHIYEIGEEQGQRYIAMEYVRGRTLRQALRLGPLEICEALDIAIQTATALAAAHEAGVFHRDIKPENIMLGADGYVKVLDFGLAKLVGNKSPTRAPEATAILSLNTEPELLMGTSDYMSPEQVRRQPADERTDLWSLGVVLYEMLAGRRPFTGREPREVIVAILEQEPEPLDHARQGLPPALQEVMAKALRKSTTERYQSAQHMANEMRCVRRSMEEDESGIAPDMRTPQPRHQGDTLPAGPQAMSSAEISRPYGALGRMVDFKPNKPISKRVFSFTRRWRLLCWLVLISMAVVGLYFGFVRQSRQTLRDQEINLKFKRLNLSGNISDIALSPDGRYVARVVSEEGKQTIRVAEVATASDLRVAKPSAAGYSGLSFSPDGTYIYYLENQTETGTLYRVSKLGGGQRRILDDINSTVTFSPDGTRLAFVRSNRTLDTPDLMVAQADGTSERLLARRTRADTDAFMSDMKRAGPVWSPDGKMLACPTFSLLHNKEMNLEVLDVETGVGRRLNVNPWYDISRAAWLADGSGLVVSTTEAEGMPWQLQLLAYPTGEIRKLTNDPNNYLHVSGTRDSSLFLTLNIEEDSSIWQVSVGDRATSNTSDVAQMKGVSEILWGGTGRFLYTISDGNHTNIWAQEAGTAMKQLTFEADNLKPALSPDGRYMVFVSTRAGAMNIWRTNADGTQPTQLTSGTYEDVPSVTPDGKWVIYRTGNSIRKVSVNGGNTVRLFDKSALCPIVSPAGQLLAFFTNDQPDSQTWHVEVYDLNSLAVVKRFELPEATAPFNGLRLTPDNRLRWTPDGLGLTYVSRADGASNVWLQSLAGGPPRQLTHFKDAEMPSFAWSPDGKQLACVRSTKAYVPMLVRFFE